MVQTIVFLLFGLALVTLASDWLVDGSSAVARRAGMSEFVIGMTIVGIGTSMPELVSSMFSAIEGRGDLAIGNITGSNICNVLLILGVSGVLSPLAYSRNNIRVDVPICIAVTALVSLMIYRWNPFGQPTGMSRIDGIILLLGFILFMTYSIRNGKKEGAPAESGDSKEMKLWKAIVLCILGIGGLVVGGKLFVDNTVALAQALGVSDGFIAVTLMALGTSVPELATCVVAVLKKKNDLALGNIIGSNISNILLILGTCATIMPLKVSSLTSVDMGLFMLSPVVLITAAWFFRRRVLDRADASLYLLLYAGYVYWLVINI